MDKNIAMNTQGEDCLGLKQVRNIVNDAISQPTVENQERERLRQILQETRIRSNTEVPPAEYALEIDGKGFFALRDIHAVKAKAKAGKTTVLKVFVAALLLGEMFRLKSLLTEPRLLYFDTEQNANDTKLILESVWKPPCALYATMVDALRART